jgi:hypothetical protein
METARRRAAEAKNAMEAAARAAGAGYTSADIRAAALDESHALRGLLGGTNYPAAAGVLEYQERGWPLDRVPTQIIEERWREQAAAIALLPGGIGSESRQHGGPVEAWRPYLVGERGPEIVVPRAAGAVVDAGRTRDLLDRGGGGPQVTVIIQNHGIIGTADISTEIARKVQQALDRWNRRERRY